MSKRIIICADDFAQNEAISEGILSVARMKRINAISCLTNMPGWSDMSTALSVLKETHFIGLHINLTFGQPLSAKWRKHEGEYFSGLSNVAKKSYLRKLEKDVVMAEIQAQIDVFTHNMHVYPDFIDGHQHIQQFPVIRQAVLDIHKKQMGHLTKETDSDDLVADEHHSFFRHTYNSWPDFFSFTGFPKCQLLAILGGRRFKHMLIREQMPTNTTFAGVYHFRHAANYRSYFQHFLKKTQDGGLIMCHPGQQSNDLFDPLRGYRHHELNYLMSDLFLTDIEDNGFRLAVGGSGFSAVGSDRGCDAF